MKRKELEISCDNLRLLYSKMCIDTCITSCAREVFVFPVWDMLLGSGISVLFSQAEVD